MLAFDANDHSAFQQRREAASAFLGPPLGRLITINVTHNTYAFSGTMDNIAINYMRTDETLALSTTFYTPTSACVSCNRALVGVYTRKIQFQQRELKSCLDAQQSS